MGGLGCTYACFAQVNILESGDIVSERQVLGARELEDCNLV
jgi:hypothetical protein